MTIRRSVEEAATGRGCESGPGDQGRATAASSRAHRAGPQRDLAERRPPSRRGAYWGHQGRGHAHAPRASPTPSARASTPSKHALIEPSTGWRSSGDLASMDIFNNDFTQATAPSGSRTNRARTRDRSAARANFRAATAPAPDGFGRRRASIRTAGHQTVRHKVEYGMTPPGDPPTTWNAAQALGREGESARSHGPTAT